MKSAIRDPNELAERLNLPKPSPAQIKAAKSFGLFVPEAFLRRIRHGDPTDPLLRQVLADAEEVLPVKGFHKDPLAEADAKRAAGLLQKYRGRVLVVANSVCAIHCRYCFRRHFPYEQTPHSDSQWQVAIDEVAADRSISEVIFSGGDPWSLVDEKLIPIVQAFDEIPHIKRIRFHTRLPIVIPDRVTDELVDMLSGLQSKAIVVIHCNHAQEIDYHVQQALARLKPVCLLLNQSVLLRGVNDSLEALMELSNLLIDCDVMPYYLHQLDRVQGAHHFEVSVEKGLELIEQMRVSLPGYAVPRFVREEPGMPYKTVLG